MANFSELDENNIVIRVLVTDNNDPNNDEGYQWLLDNLGGRWEKTSYNTFANQHALGKTPFRYNFGSIGSFFDESAEPNGAFIHPKPYSSWVLDKSVYAWKAPVPYPTDTEEENVYTWNEESLNWDLVLLRFS